jgi:DeoR/GlpR family transcriptional regulator of sugar metabolism
MIDFIAERGSVSLPEIAAHFDVSLMTVYRDIEHLTTLAAVRRVPGGVSTQPSSVFESNLQYRQSVHLQEKEALAHRALERVETGMSIMLDDGTTMMPMMPGLMEIGQLTIITGFTPFLEVLRDAKNIDLIVLGGTYRRRHDCVVGHLCEDMIGQLRADLLFLSTSAIWDGQVLHQEQEMVGVKRAMMQSCGERILLADHSKLGRRATHCIASVAEFDHVFIDSAASEEELAHAVGFGTPHTVVPV